MNGMNSNSKTGKRVTVKLKCPNPLFEEWLSRWKDEAAAKDSKMQYSFNLALKSLRKYPLPFESGRDCKILKGFGDKLCKMLDDKLRAHKKLNGNIQVQGTRGTLLPTDNIEPHENIAKKRKTPVAASGSGKGNGNNTNQYIPQYGSGGYAILVALYTQSLQPNYQGFLTKAQIIEHGKDLAKSSFTKPDPGSRYTAWSSMRTLLAKKLVYKISHPPKFSLTDEGYILSKKLFESSIKQKGNAVVNNSSSFNCKSPLDIEDNAKSYDIDILDDFTDNLFENCLSPQNDTFSVNDGYSIKSSVSSEAVKIGKPMEIYLQQSLEENGVLEKKYKLPVQRFASSPSVSNHRQLFIKNDDKTQPNKQILMKYSSANNMSSSGSVLGTDSKLTFKKCASSSSLTSTTNIASTFDRFVMASYSFDIILYVDNNETSGSSSSADDEIVVGLKKSGVKFEVKNLKVGDFTWICRDRATKKELILPYIVERKRMDDFAHSIRDRRYHEQKFRLKKSGIENLIYLVESHGRNQHLGLPLQTLCQAATNTAIQENFFIKFTENFKDTVEYLVQFSKMLIEMFKSKTLASCCKHDIQPMDINNDVIALMTFQEFNESSVKNKKMEVTDLFIKMLIQIKGMSVDRALAITQMYPTPHLLKIGYETTPERKGETLLSNIKYGVQGKRIGATLSKIVYDAFNKIQY